MREIDPSDRGSIVMSGQSVASESTTGSARELDRASELRRSTRPRLADGTQLLGEYKDSGYREPPCLIRRRDGQVIQLSRLLYTVAAAATGRQSLPAIAEKVRAETGMRVDVPGIAYLLDTKLRPLGLLEARGRCLRCALNGHWYPSAR
jgi:hypothetical protein